ncbi:MAG: thermonuclease family protein [Intrasporangiaceae bacterium]|nr:thermonuclease family protein [Intrasporangiaceae bacterium]
MSGKVYAAITIASLATVGTVTTVNALVAEPITVQRVIDGDTIDVVQGSTVTRVRLLNVDAPETKHPNEFVQCMGPEATRFLEDLLPVGTKVKLEYDVARTDRFGRDLAGVFLDKQLVNAEIARAGLGVAVSFAPNTKFFDSVKAAETEARANGVGIHDPAIECTFPAQVATFTQTTETLTSADLEDASLDELQSHLAEIVAATAAATTLLALLDSDDSGFLAAAHGQRWLPKVRQNSDRLTTAADETRSLIAAEQERLRVEAERREQERLEAERLEQERIEAERLERERLERERLEAERREEERRAAERAEAERQAANQRQQSQSSSSGGSRSQSSGSSSGSSSSGGSSGKYTGCRAYGGKWPSNAIDEKGRPFTKIDCNTKRPIGG